MPENVVIVGANSGIARALSIEMARRGCALVLAGRNLEELEKNAADLRIQFGNEVFVERFDAIEINATADFFERCNRRFSASVNGVVVCHGVLPEQESAQRDVSLLHESIDVNFTSVAALLEVFAAAMQARGSGYLAAISSVAGDRGRQSNYIYGAAKAGLSAYLQGLRNRLFPAGVHVLTVKPGFVATRMSRGKVNPKSPLLATPERVAKQIDHAIRRRKNVIYATPIWRPIMAIIRAIPEPIFKRLKL